VGIVGVKSELQICKIQDFYSKNGRKVMFKKVLTAMLAVIFVFGFAGNTATGEEFYVSLWEMHLNIQNAANISEDGFYDDVVGYFQMPGGFNFIYFYGDDRGNIEIRLYAYSGPRGAVTLPRLADARGNIHRYTIDSEPWRADYLQGYENITSLTIPANTIRQINDHGLGNGLYLRTVTIGEGWQEIHANAFSRPTLEEITLPRSIRYISETAFTPFVTELDGLGGIHEEYPTIRGYAGSYAETYARERGITFIPIAEAQPEPEPTPEPTPAPPNANPRTTFIHTGETITPVCAMAVGGSTYVRLRDSAIILRDTPYSFDIVFDSATGTITLVTGRAIEDGELSPPAQEAMEATLAETPILLNGLSANMTAYRINSATYVSASAFAEVFNFEVAWEADTQTVFLIAEDAIFPELEIELEIEPETEAVFAEDVSSVQSEPIQPAQETYEPTPQNENSFPVVLIILIIIGAVVVCGIVIYVAILSKINKIAAPATKNAIAYCSSCGAVLSSTDTAFCHKCGKSIKL